MAAKKKVLKKCTQKEATPKKDVVEKTTPVEQVPIPALVEEIKQPEPVIKHVAQCVEEIIFAELAIKPLSTPGLRRVGANNIVKKLLEKGLLKG